MEQSDHVLLYSEDGFSNHFPTSGISTGLRELVMNRRRFLVVAAGIVGLSGCLDDPSDPSRNGVWEEGSAFIGFDEHNMSEEFSGTIRIVPDCRDDDVEIQITDGQPQNSIPYERNEHGEECSFELYIDGEKQESISIRGTEICGIWVDSDRSIHSGCEVI